MLNACSLAYYLLAIAFICVDVNSSVKVEPVQFDESS